ncbi:uncharacterized protein HMPREF1541_00998 [Cyphellophora europaea CBS 101466]|uniref:SPRY domain-containing protein n=1 Tax=Cyphellophora europaea (strain CBS 101466) TaxID=1220924 RepID=W2SFY9_CYPE1|nr:uncharacterized protein HMPREF1541_00998 [Cyphellophora europaea CBS 101466]ETN46809.1 hypothetical protein HMPREF1541_00998 [Cyphellophora europaea CBS 101466]
MGFFKSLKGKVDVGTNSEYQTSASNNTKYNSSTHDDLSTANDKRRLFGISSSSRSQASQSQQSSSSTYAPPAGPPPSKETYQAPPGPPPTLTNPEPPPYHDWTSVPDNSQLPPPPAFFAEFSPANNASLESAEAAHQWCERYPPYAPCAPSQPLIDAANSGNLTLDRPPNLSKSSSLTRTAPGTYSAKTKPSQPDTILLSTLPIYFAAAANPLHTEQVKTIYYEAEIKRIHDANSIVAIGFAGMPYPPWRLPGWHRASIGVHSDDGRRYINDSFGGVDFVRPFGVGDVVGLGVRFGTEAKTDVTVKTRCFFVRNGREEGSWDVDEERDQEHVFEGVQGLEGEGDLHVAVGLSGGVEVDIRLMENQWQYRS